MARRSDSLAVYERQKDKRTASGDGLLAHIHNAELQAHRDGFHVTAHALNAAKNCLGWEIAGEIELAGMAARGERPGK